MSPPIQVPVPLTRVGPQRGAHSIAAPRMPALHPTVLLVSVPVLVLVLVPVLVPVLVSRPLLPLRESLNWKQR